MDGFPMSGASSSKIVNPDVIFTDQNKKTKANLNSFQVGVLARGEALERCLSDPDENVVLAFMDEMRQHSRSLISKDGGYSIVTYAEVAKSRVIVEDRKKSITNADVTV